MLGVVTVPPSDLDWNNSSDSDLTKYFSLRLDHIASDLQLLVQGLGLHLRRGHYVSSKI